MIGPLHFGVAHSGVWHIMICLLSRRLLGDRQVERRGPSCTGPNLQMRDERHPEPSLSAVDVEVSVVIAAYRGAATIADCLRSVVRATEGRRREIIVVESSGDATTEIVPASFPDVMFVRSPDRLSAGAARNRGFALARGRLVFVTDQDCVVPPDWIDRLERHFTDPSVGAVGGSVGVRNPNNLSGMALYFLEFLSHFPTGGSLRRNGNFVIGCNSAYRAATLRAVSFPDQTLGEDVLFSHEIQRHGLDIVYDPSVEIRHQNREGWREFFKYNRKMGRSAAHYHKVLRRRWMAPFLRMPALVFLAPLVILPMIAVDLTRARWSYLARFLVLSPMCLLGNLVWAHAFRRAVLDARERRGGSAESGLS